MPNDMTPNQDRFEAAQEAVINEFSKAAPDPDADIHNETKEEFEAKLEEHGLEGILNGDDDLTDEELQAARDREEKRREDATEAAFEDEETQKKRKDDFNKAADPSADGAKFKYLGSHAGDLLMYGIRNKGTHFNYNGDKVSDKQLRRMLLRGHLEKGWETMYFYDKKGKIDQGLTARANNIVASFHGSKDPRLANMKLSISSTSMAQVEPFRAGNPVAHVSKALENMGRKFDAKREQWKNTGVVPVVGKGISNLIG